MQQPLLIVQGDLDTQIEPPNADRLEALARARKNAPPVEMVKVPGVNHLLVPAKTGEVDEYGTLQDKQVSPAVTEAIIDVAAEDALGRALAIARAYVASRADRPVWPTTTLHELRAALGGPLPADPIDPADVIDALARAAEPGLVTTTGPRYFGFVTGGALPATVARRVAHGCLGSAGKPLRPLSRRLRRRGSGRRRGCSSCSGCRPAPASAS